MAVLTCKELVEIITEYFEGTLSDEERTRFEAHLAKCRGCTNYVAQMRMTIEMMGKLNEAHVQPPARDKLLAAFRDWRKSEE